MAIRALLCTLAVPVRTRRRVYGRDYARTDPHMDSGHAPARAVRCGQALPVLGLPLTALIAAAISQCDQPEGKANTNWKIRICI